MKYFFQAFSQFSFEGRVSRKEFWMFYLVTFFSMFLCALGDIFFGLEIRNLDYGVLSLVFSLAVMVPALSMQTKRLHDIGKSGLWILIAIVPFIGFFTLLYFYCEKTELADNKYGPIPDIILKSMGESPPNTYTNESSPKPIQSEITPKSEPPQTIKPAPKICYCRECGFQLVPESMFCSKCGTKVMKEW